MATVKEEPLLYVCGLGNVGREAEKEADPLPKPSHQNILPGQPPILGGSQSVPDRMWT